MRVIFKPSLIVLAPDTEADHEALAEWRTSAAGHVFHLSDGPDVALHDLGPRADACREPINIVFDQVAPNLRPISNLAETPFFLRRRSYASVEGFWQGLRFESDADRRRVGALSGLEARRASHGVPKRDSFVLDGAAVSRGSPAHHALMLEACSAKFSQNAEARDALLSTGERPLTHIVRRDSITIPGALMADIWMRIRATLG